MCIRFSVMPCNICENCSLKRANSPARRAIRQVQKFFESSWNVEGSYIKKYAFLSPGFQETRRWTSAVLGARSRASTLLVARDAGRIPTVGDFSRQHRATRPKGCGASWERGWVLSFRHTLSNLGQQTCNYHAGDSNRETASRAASATASATAAAAAASGDSAAALPSPSALDRIKNPPPPPNPGDGAENRDPPAMGLGLGLPFAPTPRALGGRSIDATPRPSVDPPTPAALAGVPVARAIDLGDGEAEAFLIRRVSSSCCRLTQARDVSASTEPRATRPTPSSAPSSPPP